MSLLPEDNPNPLESAEVRVEPIRPKKIGELSQQKGIKVVVRGRENSFKTGAGLLFPTPEVIDLELGTADLASFHKGRDVTVWETMIMKEKYIDGKPCFDLDKVESIYQFEIAFGEALRSKSESIIIDSISELYDWAQEFMKVAGKGLSKKTIMASSYRQLLQRKDMSSFDFGISNDIMHNTIMKGMLTNKNFYIITQDQEIWENNKPTGEYKPAWMKKIPFWMPIIVNMTVENNPLMRMKKYYATIEKYRGHSEVVGEKKLLMTISGTKATIEGSLYDWLVAIKNNKNTESNSVINQSELQIPEAKLTTVAEPIKPSPEPEKVLNQIATPAPEQPKVEPAKKFVVPNVMDI